MRWALIVALLVGTPALSQSAELAPISAAGPLRLELPLLDAGANTARGYRAPSMAQSLAVSRDLTTGVAWAIDYAFERSQLGPGPRWGLESASLIAGATLFFFVPFGSTWNHEEFHRATMGWRGINSFDDVYYLRFGTSTSVSHVADDDLVRLKRDHPAELARLSAAGMEGDIELARSISHADFLDGRDFKPNLPSVVLTRLNVVAYMFQCDDLSGDEMTAAATQAEPAPETRDFTGLDCVGWAYDVQRPDEAYQARGPHPLGVGIDRYRKTTDLTPDERRLLTSAKWLSLANLVDLSLLGVGFRAPFHPDWRWTFGLAQQMTSFGQALTLDLLARGPDHRLRATYRHYLSQRLGLPGLELEWVRLGVRLGGVRLEVTPRLALWLQPAGQRWDALGAAPGAQLQLRVGWPLSPRLSAFGEVAAKSEGWVPGTVLIEPGLEGRVGLAATL